MKKFLIEFYSEHLPENLISLLNDRYDGVYFLYFSQLDNLPQQEQDRLAFSIEQHFRIKTEYLPVPEQSIPSVLQELHRLQSDAHYTLDITGGNEIFIASAGMILAEKYFSEARLCQYDIQSGKRALAFPDADKINQPEQIRVGANEFLSLSGFAPISAHSYDFSGPISREILRLWNAVKRHAKPWNNFCSGPKDPDSDYDPPITQKYLNGQEPYQSSYALILPILKQADIIRADRNVTIFSKPYLEFDLNIHEEARFLYLKGGNLLEMYCAMAAHESKLFHSILVSVSLDCDGVNLSLPFPQPTNEIDLILMRNNLPIFVSCKNTAPQNEYLYEISVMAKHYGGKYARPALFSSTLASPSVRRRAKEMGILLLDGIAGISFAEFCERLRLLFREA